MKAPEVAKTNFEKEKEAMAQAVAAMIRQSSEAGQLIAESEILCRLAQQHPLPSPGADGAEEVGRILKEALEGCKDLQRLVAPDGTRRYYSSRFMAEAYAAILMQKEGDPLRFIAETVRENSAAYPRPVLWISLPSPLCLYRAGSPKLSGTDGGRRGISRYRGDNNVSIQDIPLFNHSLRGGSCLHARGVDRRRPA